MTAMKGHKIVHVVWEDAWASDQTKWTAEELAKEDPYFVSCVGFLIHENKDRIILASERRPDADSYKRVQGIPRSLIRSMKVLK